MEKQRTKQITIEIIICLVALILFILVAIVILKKTTSQFLEFCAAKDWEGVYIITGDFSGEINCKEIWETEYTNGMWAEKCSDSTFSTLPSCKWLCVQDCKLNNNFNSVESCVC